MAEEGNIFDAASEKGKRPKKKRPSKKEPPPAPPTDEEVEEMLNRINVLRRKLEKKMEEVYATQGLTYQQVNEYLENRANFSDSEWDLLQQRREEVRKELEADLAGGAVTTKKKKGVKKGKKKIRRPKKGWLKMD